MTILPKKKSSQPKSDRDSAGGVDSFTSRGLPQNQVRFYMRTPTDSLHPSLKEFIMADICLP